MQLLTISTTKIKIDNSKFVFTILILQYQNKQILLTRFKENKKSPRIEDVDDEKKEFKSKFDDPNSGEKVS